MSHSASVACHSFPMLHLFSITGVDLHTRLLISPYVVISCQFEAQILSGFCHVDQCVLLPAT